MKKLSIVKLILGLMVLALAPLMAFAQSTGTPSFSTIGAQNIETDEAAVQVYYDSNGATYDWDTEPKISIVYTNESTGVSATAGTVGESSGSRTTTFSLRNLTPDTYYSYEAIMSYNGTTYQNSPLTFQTSASSSTTDDNSEPTPTGTPAFSLVGASDVTSNGAVVTISYDSNSASYEWSEEPKVSVSYVDMTDGTTETTAAIGESDGTRTTTLPLNDLDPNTKYSITGIMFYAGQRYQTGTQTFKTLAASASSSTGSSSDQGISFITSGTTSTSASAAVAIGVSKVASNLESIVKTGGYGQSDGVSLSITDQHARVLAGDSFSYTIDYNNSKSTALRSARIVVQLPDEYTFDSGDGSTVYTNSSNVVTIYLGTVDPNESGTVTFNAKASGTDNSSVQTKAVLIYTGGSVSATDRDTYVGGSQSVLGASVFGSGFFPQTFFGWLIIIVILIIVMIVARRYMTKPVKKTPENK